MAETQAYLVSIARHQFGAAVSKCVESLLVHGKLTLIQLTKLINQSANQSHQLDGPTIKKSLAVGLQHGFITCTFERKGPIMVSMNQTAIDPKSIKVLYAVNQSVLACRLRYPSFCVRARSMINGAAELCVQALCLHGILTTNQLLNHAITLSSNQSIDGVTRDDVTNGLRALVGHRFVRKALINSSSDITQSLSQSNPDGEAELSLAQSSSQSTTQPKSDTKKRKRGAADDSAAAEPAPKKRGRKSAAAAAVAQIDPVIEPTNQSSNSQSLQDSPFDDIVLNPEDHWILNDKRFTQENVRDGVVDFALDRFGSSGALIVRSMIDVYPIEYVKPPTMSPERIHGIITSQPAITQPISLQTVQSTLLSMSKHESHFLVALDSGYELRVPNWQIYARSLHVSSVLHSKYGMLASRLFRVLENHGKLEETQLADLCTASRKQVREILHRLMADEWVTCTEVPRTADRAPTKTFFLWSVDRQRVTDRMVNALLMSARKLNERIAHESQQVSDIVAKLEMQRPIDEHEKQAIDHWTRATARLEHSLKEVMNVKSIAFE